jgi:hypothetical protein
MLTISGSRQRFCDGVSRRNFLQIGALGFAGITLPNLLRAEGRAGSQSTGKSIINIYLPGGPSHMDMFDMKPLAAKEFRGDFSPIPTNVAGMEICEHMPRLATLAEKFSVIRSLTGVNEEHTPNQSDSGWSFNSLREMGGRPGIGSVMTRLWGPQQTTSLGGCPTFVDLTGWTQVGFLGQVCAGFRPDNEGRSNLTLNGAISPARLNDRQSLLGGLDRLRREADGRGMMSAMDSFTDRAVSIVTSGEMAKAIDLRNEDPRSLDRYGATGNQPFGSTQNFVLARRLVQAGVRCVGLSWGGWDTHGNNFGHLKGQLPRLDTALAALIEDLDAHGLLEDTLVLMSGEFGRTPRVNGSAGRDHWPRASFFFLAGGGLKHGQMIGTTNRTGEYPVERPVPLQNVFHTVYHTLGIDANAVTLTDANGRPQYLVDDRQLVRELV